jgi:hypothetical protein
LLRLIAGARATAIIGIWTSCNTNIYNLIEQINRFTNKKDGSLARAHRNFFVTTAMTSSWAAAERRNVTNMARERDNWYELMVDA